MRLIAAAVLALAFAIATPASAQTVAQQTSVCGITEAEFLASAVRKNNAKVMVASDAARHLILEKINESRRHTGMWDLEADKLMVGIIRHEGRTVIGIVMFKDGCVVPGTVKVVEAQAWIAFLTELNLSMDDFTKQEEA